MAFLRFSRDKRGYEHFYLVEATTDRRGKTRARVLYWFRTPPGVKVGREPFDADVRRALEAQNPGVTFDWRKIVETPIPSADVERWRERRRAERAEKAARQTFARERQQQGEPVAGPDDEADVADAADNADDVAVEDLSLDAAERQADALAPTEESLVAESATIDPMAVAAAIPAAVPGAAVPVGHRRRRRRRRGSRGSQGSQGSQGSESSQGSPVSEPREPDEPSEPREPRE